MVITNITLVLVVFSGGPHTAPRLEKAVQIVQSERPAIVFLTGMEFTLADESGQVPAEHFKTVVPAIELTTDQSSTTLASCWHVAARIRSLYSDKPVRVLAVTSNYHAPRARWLFEAFLPRNCTVTWHTSDDITRANWRATERHRRLIRGEVISWFYCGPIGLMIRPAWMLLALAGFLALVLARKRGRRVRARETAPSSPP
ncbi:MAG: YdcF family protein [Kiritimatiellia bacterium]|nr:YdcF family protein [Kiritimatiellia bacterium]